MKHVPDPELFTGIYGDVWRAIRMVLPTHDECDYVEEVWRSVSSRSIADSSFLDLMCGEGRHVLDLAGRGARVHAVDGCQKYVEKLLSDAEGLQITTECSDVRTWSTDSKFDVVSCWGNSLSGLTPEEVESLVVRISNILNPNGMMLLQTWSNLEISERHPLEYEFTVGDYTVNASGVLDRERSRLDSVSEISGPIDTEICFSEYLHSVFWLRDILEAQGLHVDLRDGITKGPFDPQESMQLIAVASRH